MLLFTAVMLPLLLLLLPPTMADSSPWTSLLDGSRHFVGDSDTSSGADVNDDHAASKYGAVWAETGGAKPIETETETGWTRKVCCLVFFFSLHIRTLGF
jgi:hypothetical protein